MPILDIFSKRQKRIRSELPDVYQYTDVPRPLRIQIIHILRDALGDPSHYRSSTQEAFRVIHDALSREYGMFSLNKESSQEGDFRSAVFTFLLSTQETEKVLDVIELSFRMVLNVGDDYSFREASRPTMDPKAAVEELNERCREHCVGFQFESGELIRVDSQILHQEVIRPALHLLTEPDFEGANEEFLSAHEHYRHDRLKESLNDCLKAFESTMKIICKRRYWEFKESDTAKSLLDTIFSKGLLPSYLQSEFTSLRSALESGIGPVRNRLSGHGQGAQPTSVPSYLVAFLLHLTGASIVLLVQAEKGLGNP